MVDDWYGISKYGLFRLVFEIPENYPDTEKDSPNGV